MVLRRPPRDATSTFLYPHPDSEPKTKNKVPDKSALHLPGSSCSYTRGFGFLVLQNALVSQNFFIFTMVFVYMLYFWFDNGLGFNLMEIGRTPPKIIHVPFGRRTVKIRCTATAFPPVPPLECQKTKTKRNPQKPKNKKPKNQKPKTNPASGTERFSFLAILTVLGFWFFGFTRFP